MAWTDERVETLKKLWADGLSASQIAKQLGGVTRNAVIGKVHRLGLSGRAAPSRPTRRVAAPKLAPRQRSASTPAQAGTKAKISNGGVPAMARPPAPAPVPVEPHILPSGDYATVLTLREGMIVRQGMKSAAAISGKRKRAAPAGQKADRREHKQRQCREKGQLH